MIKPTTASNIANMADTDDTFDPIAYLNHPRWQEVKPGLERISALMEALGNPQDGLKFVHVAGTNGKGSTCALISSITREAGYKTGLFTSPYIVAFEERIQINGTPIPYEELTRITLTVKAAADALPEHPTEFELMTAVALCYFAQVQCDLVVLEVGLGGRLDSTNVIADTRGMCYYLLSVLTIRQFWVHRLLLLRVRRQASSSPVRVQ